MARSRSRENASCPHHRFPPPVTALPGSSIRLPLQVTLALPRVSRMRGTVTPSGSARIARRKVPDKAVLRPCRRLVTARLRRSSARNRFHPGHASPCPPGMPLKWKAERERGAASGTSGRPLRLVGSPRARRPVHARLRTIRRGARDAARARSVPHQAHSRRAGSAPSR